MEKPEPSKAVDGQTQKESTPRSTRMLISVAWSSAEVGLVYWAVVTQETGPSNLVKLLAVINTILFPFVFLTAAHIKEASRAGWVLTFCNCCDLVSTVTLAWFGWWWCSVAFALSAVGAAVFREKERSLTEVTSVSSGGPVITSVSSNPKSDMGTQGESVTR